MKLYLHFAVVGFSNTYLLGPDKGGDAILIDPAVIDIELLRLIEGNGFYIRHVLITHNHNSHTEGIRTLKKIYDFDIYSGNSPRAGKNNIQLVDGKSLQLGEMAVEPILAPGHSPDSYLFKIDHMLFTGDSLAAGRLGKAPSYQARSILLEALKTRILPLPGDLLIFPGHGPPTTLEAEVKFNPYLNGKKMIPKNTIIKFSELSDSAHEEGT